MKIAGKEAVRSRRLRRVEPVILFSVAHQTFVIAAEAVQEIRSTDSMGGTAVEIDHPQLEKVRHTIERAPRAYYVVNAGVHFGLPVTRPTLVLILRQVRVAVLVDRIERMTEISAVHPLPHAYSGAERRWYRGLVYLDDYVLPMIDPAGFLTAPEFALLDRSVNLDPSGRQMEGALPA
jgi:chemotaxis signal transduction protein